MNADKIEQFSLLAKGMRGLALSDLITKATAEPGVYTFGELLALPQVQSLAQTDQAAALSLLRLFAYGTWPDYRASAASFGALSDGQARKLKALTVSSLASSRRTLPYDDLRAQLDIDSVRQLEDLLISDCIYSGVVKGRLDQRAGAFFVEDALARDIAPEGLGKVVATLQEWLGDARRVVDAVGAQAEAAAAAAAAIELRQKELEGEVAKAKENIQAQLDAKAAQQPDVAMMREGEGFAPGGGGGSNGDDDGEEGGRSQGFRMTKRRK